MGRWGDGECGESLVKVLLCVFAPTLREAAPRLCVKQKKSSAHNYGLKTLNCKLPDKASIKAIAPSGLPTLSKGGL